MCPPTPCPRTSPFSSLVTSRRDGRLVYYAAAFDRVRDLVGFLLEDCCAGNADMCGEVEVIARQAACCVPEKSKA
jgi:ArsR family transcriptional regulator, arsenate/arsenite/antimonite-responsive transcriptional repressor